MEFYTSPNVAKHVGVPQVILILLQTQNEFVMELDCNSIQKYSFLDAANDLCVGFDCL